MKKTKISIIVFCVLLLSVSAYCETENSTLIAVASSGREPESQIERAGRSPYFLLFDKEANMVEAVDNPFADARRQAGVSSVGFLYKKNVRVIIAESFGDRIEEEIKNRAMKNFQYRGRADEAVKAFLQKK